MRTNERHGLSAMPEYRIWSSMKGRCLNSKDKGFKNYGARGISVCAKWLKFSGFFEDMGPRPDAALSLERINNDGNYCPENCKWGTRQEQGQNTRRVLKISQQGVTKCGAEWARNVGGHRGIVMDRLRRGWTLDQALKPKDFTVRRQRVFLTYQGKIYDVRDLAKERGWPTRIILDRLKEGWTIERALTQPKRKSPAIK